MAINVVEPKVGSKRKIIKVVNPIKLPRKLNNVHDATTTVKIVPSVLNLEFEKNVKRFEAYSRYVSKARFDGTTEGMISLQSEFSTFSTIRDAFHEYVRKHELNKITYYAFIDEEEMALYAFNQLFNNIYNRIFANDDISNETRKTL